MSEAPTQGATGSPPQQALGNAPSSQLLLAPSTTSLLDLPPDIILSILDMVLIHEPDVKLTWLSLSQTSYDRGASLRLTCRMLSSLVLARTTRMVFQGTNKQTGELSSLLLRLLQAMPNLQLLDLRQCQDLPLSLVGLPTTITIMRIRRTTKQNAGLKTYPLLDLSPLSKCIGLKKLDISGNRVVDLSPLAACKDLDELDICGCFDLTSLPPLAQCTNLRHIDLGRTSIADLCPLSACKELETIICCNSEVPDLSPLSACSKLRKVDCQYTTVSDLSPLSACLKLERVNCMGTSVRDITSSLAACPHLDTIDCDMGVNGLEVDGEGWSFHPAFPAADIYLHSVFIPWKLN